MIFKGEMKVHLNPRIIAHLAQLRCKTCSLTLLNRHGKLSMVKVSNCCKISAAFYDEKSRNQTCISNQQRVRVKSAIPLMGFLRVFSAEATTNDYVHRFVPFCCF